MSKQTAVEWLVRELNQKIDFIPMDKWDMIRDTIEQAKAMEREQIEAAYIHKRCLNDQTVECAANAIDGAEKYYMNTYKRKE
jgi:hypothetical protein